MLSHLMLRIDGMYVIPAVGRCSGVSLEVAAVRALKVLLLQHGAAASQLASWDTDSPGEAGECNVADVAATLHQRPFARQLSDSLAGNNLC